MAKPSLDRRGIVALVGEGVAAGVAQLRPFWTVLPESAKYRTVSYAIRRFVSEKGGEDD
jgi:hypothetical protein